MAVQQLYRPAYTIPKKYSATNNMLPVFYIKSLGKPFWVMLLVLFSSLSCLSQEEDPMRARKRIFFPHPMQKQWQVSIGVVATTMAQEITEELRFRVPAIDLHILKKLGKKWYLDTRINSQIFQNQVTIGPHWNKKLTRNFSIGLGNEFGYWIGFMNLAGYKTRGMGWSNTPSISFGYHFSKGSLLTFRAESLMSLGKDTYAGETRISRDNAVMNGSAFSVFFEQPFFADKSVTLGFRAIYTNFLWQTWALFQNYERNLFYPQIIIGIIL
jgi:hypothetical protein